MGWLLEIVHETRVHYQGAARASYNEARMTPLTLPSQTALQTRVSVGNGRPVWAYHDYWGTVVSSFDIQAPHHELTVRSPRWWRPAPAPAPPAPLAWDELRAGADAGRRRVPGRHTPDHRGRGAGRGGPGADPGRRPAGDGRGHRGLGAGAGGVHAGSDRGADQRAGSLGQGPGSLPGHRAPDRRPAPRDGPARPVRVRVPAPRPKAGLGQAVAGQSHAWVEYWAGDWVAADPTNQASVGEGHVVVARGRDYGDVPPLKGFITGPRASRWT